MRILFLYTEMAGYMQSTIEGIVSKGHQVDAVVWRKGNLTSFVPEPIEGVVWHERDGFNYKDLISLISRNYSLIYVSGWQDKGYVLALMAARLRGVKTKVVCGFDDQWSGTYKQIIGASIMKFGLKSMLFDIAWVAGPRQYEFARRLGFSKKSIIFHLLSCDDSFFHHDDQIREVDKVNRFIYVGSFTHQKGFDVLLDAFQIYRTKYNGSWDLLCIGTNVEKFSVNSSCNVIFSDFADKRSVKAEMLKSRIFILPSRLDQWGVVVQEAAAVGLPLILSSGVGAGDVFLLDGYNGSLILDASAADLAREMHKLAGAGSDTLDLMGCRSIRRAAYSSVDMSVASFLSVVK